MPLCKRWPATPLLTPLLLPLPCPALPAEEATMVQFRAAMALTGAEFSEAVQYYAKVGGWAVQLQLYRIVPPCSAAYSCTARRGGGRLGSGRSAPEGGCCLPCRSLMCPGALPLPRIGAVPLPLCPAAAPHVQSWLPARTHVKEALEQLQQVHPSGETSAVHSSSRDLSTD